MHARTHDRTRITHDRSLRSCRIQIARPQTPVWSACFHIYFVVLSAVVCVVPNGCVCRCVKIKYENPTVVARTHHASGRTQVVGDLSHAGSAKVPHPPRCNNIIGAVV